MRFKGLDLNLLFALQILLEERSVSRAADRLNVSQPAMSAALARMREYFGDELLVPVGRQMVPTAHAESLRPLVAQMLGKAEELISISSSFDPKSSRRRFRVSASDYMVTVLIGPLLRRLAVTAPMITLDVFPTGSEITTGLERGDIDLVVSPEQYVSPHHPAQLLLVEDHVILGWEGNPAMAQPIDHEAFFALGHVAVRIGAARETSFAEQQLAPFIEPRRIEVTTNSFSSVPGLVSGTHRIAIVQQRLAEAFIGMLPLVTRPIPFDLPLLNEMVQYHTARASDPGISWLVMEMKGIFAHSQ